MRRWLSKTFPVSVPARHVRTVLGWHGFTLSEAGMPRDLAILACTECKRRNYTTTRNKRTQPNRLEIKKYCPAERKHTLHRESK